MYTGFWLFGLYVVTAILKVYWPKYGGAQKPLPPTKKGFLAAGAMVLPIGRFRDPAFKDDPNTPAAICRAGMNSNLDGAQFLALLGAIVWSYLPDQRLIIGLVVAVFFVIGRASGFWSALRRIEKGQDPLKKPTLAPN